MNLRSYRGKVLYLTDGVGEMGREHFHVTITPDGTRTLRATCEMDDDDLLRDVVMTVDARWRPLDAFVRLTIGGTFAGSSWFRFTDDLAECQAYTARDGRIDQRFATAGRVASLGTHPVHGDAWSLAKFPVREPGALIEVTDLNFTTSHAANGGTGPYLMPSSGRMKRRYVGRETIDVQAGRFDAHRFQMVFSDYPPIDIWATDVDCMPLRLRWDLLRQTYELVEVSGDAR